MGKLYKSYGPIIGNLKGQACGWFCVKVDDEISNYYNSFLKKGKGGYNPCLNGAHITFIAGDREKRIVSESDMKDYLGMLIPFSYDNVVKTNSQAFWLECTAPLLNNIRSEIGLEKREQFHITLGNLK